MTEYITKEDVLDIVNSAADVQEIKGCVLNLESRPVVDLQSVLEEYESLVRTSCPTTKQIDEFCIKTMRAILCDHYVDKILDEVEYEG